MVKATRKTIIQVIFIVLALALVFITALAAFALTGKHVNSSPRMYGEEEPSTALQINSNGDVTVPAFYTSNAPIERNGNTYTLTGNIPDELIIEKSNIVLDGNDFLVGSSYGLDLSGVTNVTVQHINVEGTFYRIIIKHSQNNTVMTANCSSIYLWDSKGNLISDSTCSFEFSESSNNKVINCTTSGFELADSNYNSIINNTLSGSGRALYLQDSSNNLIFGNTFGNFWWWISMYGDSSHNTVVGNNINTDQLYLADSLAGTNYIYHNNFLDFNWNHTVTTNSANIWSSNGQGNYWADYHGIDANHDGIGDTPYIVDATNVDSYPLMAPVNIQTEPIPTPNT